MDETHKKSLKEISAARRKHVNLQCKIAKLGWNRNMSTFNWRMIFETLFSRLLKGMRSLIEPHTHTYIYIYTPTYMTPYDTYMIYIYDMYIIQTSNQNSRTQE